MSSAKILQILIKEAIQITINNNGEDGLLDYVLNLNMLPFANHIPPSADHITTGQYSIVFRWDGFVYIVTENIDTDNKKILHNCDDNPHIPYVEWLKTTDHHCLYQMPYYQVIGTKKMNDNQHKIYSMLDDLAEEYCEHEEDDLKEHIEDFPQTLQDAILIIFEQSTQNNMIMYSDIKDENIGWIDDTVILFDAFNVGY